MDWLKRLLQLPRDPNGGTDELERELADQRARVQRLENRIKITELRQKPSDAS